MPDEPAHVRRSTRPTSVARGRRQHASARCQRSAHAGVMHGAGTRRSGSGVDRSRRVAQKPSLRRCRPTRIPVPETRMTVLSVRHVTRYEYKAPVRFGDHRLMFRPRDSYDQRLISSDMAIAPEPRRVRWFHDVFGNCVAVASFGGEAKPLDVRHHASCSTTRRRTRPISSIEDYAKHLSLHLRGRGAARHLAADRAPISRSRAPARQLGPPLHPLRPADRHGRAADDADLCHQGELHLYAAARAGHPGSAADARTPARAPAATSRC